MIFEREYHTKLCRNYWKRLSKAIWMGLRNTINFHLFISTFVSNCYCSLVKHGISLLNRHTHWNIHRTGNGIRILNQMKNQFYFIDKFDNQSRKSWFLGWLGPFSLKKVKKNTEYWKNTLASNVRKNQIRLEWAVAGRLHTSKRANFVWQPFGHQSNVIAPNFKPLVFFWSDYHLPTTFFFLFPRNMVTMQKKALRFTKKKRCRTGKMLNKKWPNRAEFIIWFAQSRALPDFPVKLPVYWFKCDFFLFYVIQFDCVILEMVVTFLLPNAIIFFFTTKFALNDSACIIFTLWISFSDLLSSFDYHFFMELTLKRGREENPFDWCSYYFHWFFSFSKCFGDKKDRAEKRKCQAKCVCEKLCEAWAKNVEICSNAIWW